MAGKPVMEGKAVLFKRFADIDVFDLELDTTDPDEFIRAVKLMEPTFGGINLEDIKAPDCFYIEEQLKQQMAIPVFHDDQHGTSIISAAAMLNAVELTGRKLEKMRVVINGEMHVDTALMAEMLDKEFAFNQLGRSANVLIFPNLAAGNIGYKLVERLAGAKAVGPLLMGLSKPFNVIQRSTDMENVVNVLAITVAQAQAMKA